MDIAPAKDEAGAGGDHVQGKKGAKGDEYSEKRTFQTVQHEQTKPDKEESQEEAQPSVDAPDILFQISGLYLFHIYFTTFSWNCSFLNLLFW